MVGQASSLAVNGGLGFQPGMDDKQDACPTKQDARPTGNLFLLVGRLPRAYALAMTKFRRP